MAKKSKTQVTDAEMEALFVEPEDQVVIAEAPVAEGESVPADEPVTDEVGKPGRPAKYDQGLRFRYRSAARAKARGLNGTWARIDDDYQITPGADQGEPFLYTYEQFQQEDAEKQATKAAKRAQKEAQAQESPQGEESPEDEGELAVA